MTREIELLNALAKAKGGVQVNISQSRVVVTTRYTPLVRGRGDSLLTASIDAAQQVLRAVEDCPEWKDRCPDVLAALDDYDRGSAALRV